MNFLAGTGHDCANLSHRVPAPFEVHVVTCVPGLEEFP